MNKAINSIYKAVYTHAHNFFIQWMYTILCFGYDLYDFRKKKTIYIYLSVANRYCAPATILAYLYIRTAREMRSPEGPIGTVMFEHCADVRIRQRFVNAHNFVSLINFLNRQAIGINSKYTLFCLCMPVCILRVNKRKYYFIFNQQTKVFNIIIKSFRSSYQLYTFIWPIWCRNGYYAWKAYAALFRSNGINTNYIHLSINDT